MMEYLCLTEATLPRLLWRASIGENTCIISTKATFGPRSLGILQKTAAWLRSKGKVHDLLVDFPELVTHKDDIDLIVREDVFATQEPAIDDIFDLPNAEKRYGRYGRSYCHAVCNLSVERLLLVYRLLDIVKFEKQQPFRVSGLEPEIAKLYRKIFPDQPPLLASSVPAFLRYTFNSVVAATVAFLSISWILTRTRLAPRAPEDIFLGADFCNDPRDLLLWDEVNEDPRQIMAVFRHKNLRPAGTSILAGRRHCIWQDGAFSPMDGLASIAELIRDTTMLWRQGKHLPPNVFRTLIAQSHLRMTFRALFNVYRFRYFWDRADYNTDHIVRTQELRAVGTKSLGIMHGIASICRGMHQMRYVDYDVYFSIGRHSYEKFYKTHWPSAIDVRTIGSFGISREEHHRMARSDRKNKDVAFFIVPTVQGSATLDVAAAVAAAFPDRIVYLNSKKRYLTGSYLEEIRKHCATYNNLRLHTGRSYDLMSECGYVFSDGSTLTAEAIQFGLYGFALNLIGDRWKYNIYADFPGLLLTSAEESIDVMKKIEAGDLKYPRESYSELIDLSGRIFFDTARIALDLPPKEGVLPELAFSPTT